MLTITTINDRIQILLNATGMTKTDFGKKLKVSQAYISKLTKTGTPSPMLIDDICEKFNVNEKWLRLGEGEMFQDFSPEDEVASVISNVLEDIRCENSIYTLVKELLLKYENLDQTSKKVLDKYVDDVLKGYIEKKEE